MHCDDCGRRLQMMRVETVNGDIRFVCDDHPLPATLVGREVVRVLRGAHWVDEPRQLAAAIETAKHSIAKVTPRQLSIFEANAATRRARA